MAKKQSKSETRQSVVDNVAATLDAEVGRLKEIHEELEETRANMEEKFSETEKYQRLEELVSTLDEAIQELESAYDTISGLTMDYVNG